MVLHPVKRSGTTFRDNYKHAVEQDLSLRVERRADGSRVIVYEYSCPMCGCVILKPSATYFCYNCGQALEANKLEEYITEDDCEFVLCNFPAWDDNLATAEVMATSHLWDKELEDRVIKRYQDLHNYNDYDDYYF